jgi:hypothetical protein
MNSSSSFAPGPRSHAIASSELTDLPLVVGANT